MTGPDSSGRGDWLTARGAANRGVSAVVGSGTPPAVVGRWATGADVRQVAEFDSGVLVLAGATLQAWSWDGTLLWSDGTSAATRVLHVVGDTALVLSGERVVRRVSLRTGASTWQGVAPDGTNLSGPGSSKVADVGGRVLWFTAPTYATAVTCRELLPGGSVETRWVRDFGGHYDTGFGPVMVVDDVLGSGEPQLLLSTRTGSGYGTSDDDVSSERLVLGREDGRLLQVVLSIDDGSTVTEVAYRPDPGDYPCARPYGLLRVASAPDGERIVVMVSCQVEEYYAVTRVRDGELSRAWGRFVEKDWPHDAQELRPQVSSVVPRHGSNPWLVTGHHDGATWTTVVDDAVTGERLRSLPGHYFWGAAGTLAIVSPATARALTGREPTLAVRLDDLDAVVASHEGQPVVCGADELPADVSFHAERRSLVGLAGGVVTRQPDGTAVWWSPATGSTTPLGVPDVVGAYSGVGGAVVLLDAEGALHRIGADLSLGGVVRPGGRRAQALVVTDGDRPLVLLDGERSSRAVGLDGSEVALPGRVVAAAREPSGAAVVACLMDDGVRCVGLGGGEARAVVPARGRPTHAVLFDEARLLLVAARTGVHTATIGVFRVVDGSPLWTDPDQGPHPNTPAVAQDADGRWLVAYDDHGQLTVRDGLTGEVLAKDDWTAAYTTPMRVESPPGWLRVGGIHGIDAVDEAGAVRWRHGAPLWTYFPGEAALAGAVLGCVTRDGRLDAFSVADGRVLWSAELGAVAQRPPLVAVSLASGEGLSFVAGTADGSLVAFSAGSGERRDWSVSFGVAVETLVVCSFGGPRLLAGTADGVVHAVAF